MVHWSTTCLGVFFFSIILECFLFSASSVFCFGHHTAVMHHEATAQKKSVAIHPSSP